MIKVMTMTQQMEMMLYPADQAHELAKMQSQLASMRIDMDKMRRGLFAKNSALAAELSTLRAEVQQLRMEFMVMASYQRQLSGNSGYLPPIYGMEIT
jgi:hypothetical protein